MDFKKIEIIFILTFLILNGYLFWRVLENNQNNFTGIATNQVDLIEEMQAEGIELPNFEDKAHEVPYVQAAANNLLEENSSRLTNQTGIIENNGSLYASILSDPIKLSQGPELTTKDLEILTEFVLSNAILYGDQYQFIRYNPSSRQIIYGQVANNIPIVDGTSDLIFHLNGNKEIISYEQKYAGPVTVQGESRTLITDQDAVEILYQNNEIPTGTEVRKPLLTYSRTLHLEDLSMYVPVWLVEVVTSTDTFIKRVDAVNGSVIQESNNEAPSGSSSESSESTDVSE
ncbi:two-component system regulatory protein YycI [Desemzia sp. RIT804]|uniref:two-component system regulatory protein YycI n=1 Tax=Desemzia sp. RIT 804 TaxID=2810209 RepID=UPI001950C1E8|nr:two-component system regulatory protein YycI [Desemzia sp. RIT 804]MBM6615846.1 two-component system regulatory protein YycI [Desemzia sp. RIT 804]